MKLDRSFKLKYPWDTAPLPALAPDEQDAADTQPLDTAPLWIADGTPVADAHIARLQEIGLVTPDVDGDDDDGQ
jgi:hypothetical protein